MADFVTTAYCVVSFSGGILVLIPLTWHWQAWNAGTCYYMIWTSIACLNGFVNAVLWSSDAIDRAPVWCDISTRIIIGASVGIPSASLCISRRLYRIATMQTGSISKSEKLRDVVVDSLICVVFPILCMVFAYIVQGHRYNIFQDIGCYPAIYNTLPAYFLVYMWPLVIGIISAIYCSLSLYQLIQRQIQFQQILAANSSLTAGRYLRLMALSATEIMFTVPFAVYEIYANAATGGVQTWKGWADTHFHFSKVDQFPSLLWRMDPSVAIPLEIARWLLPACAFVFLAYFGFAEEARRRYRAVWNKVVSQRHFRTSKPISQCHKLSNDEESLPPYSGKSSTFAMSQKDAGLSPSHSSVYFDFALPDGASTIRTETVRLSVLPRSNPSHASIV